MDALNTSLPPEIMTDPAAAVAANPVGDLTAVLGELGATGSSDALNDFMATASEILTQSGEVSSDQGASLAGLFADLMSAISSQLSTVDLSDAGSLSSLQSSLSEIVNMVKTSTLPPTAEQTLLEGIADTGLSALSAAIADASMSGASIDKLITTFDDLSMEFDGVASGQSELAVVGAAALPQLIELFNEFNAQAASGEGAAGEVETLAADALTGDTGEIAVDPAVSDILGDAVEMTGESADGTIADSGEVLDTSMAELGIIDPAATDTTGSSATSSTSSGGGLATEADGESMAASDANQEALEGRFIALYEALMEKQVSFKERVEPYKTDNQNAGKG